MILALAVLLSFAVPLTSGAQAAAPSPAASGATDEQHQLYRAYVSTVIETGASVIVSTMALTGCRDGRPQCAVLIHDASADVAHMQSELATTPPPDCLVSADQKLEDALAFQQNGLNIAESAVKNENWLRLVQGALLTAAGVWRAGQAVASARQASC